jgi:hypothetical protein
MLFLFDQIIRIVYGQEEIDIGVESEGNSAVDNREGGELSVGEESQNQCRPLLLLLLHFLRLQILLQVWVVM